MKEWRNFFVNKIDSREAREKACQGEFQFFCKEEKGIS